MKRRNLLTCLILLFLSTAVNAQDQTKALLKQRFSNWQQEQIAQHNYLAEDSCYRDWFLTHAETEMAVGFPDSSFIWYAYGDLNMDGRIDQLVTFTPVLCDGGNALMWTQHSVLMLSDDEHGYRTLTDPFPYLHTEKAGFYHVETISGNAVNVIYYEFLEEDAHCCPSVAIPMTFEHAAGKIISSPLNGSAVDER